MRHLASSLSPLFGLAFLACASSPSKTGETSLTLPTPEADATGADTVGAVGTMTEAEVATMLAHFNRVHFAFDSSALDEESRTALAANAKVLLEHPSVSIEVQGHADDRGTSEYNLSLGERRARAVANYLTTSGVPSQRVQVISYGEERPLDPSPGPTGWSQNRRAEFRVVEGGGVVQGTTD